MYGYEIVELKNINGRNLRLMELPALTEFNTFVKGNLDDATLHIILEAESEDKYEVMEKLEQQRKNLKLYLNLITENRLDVISGYEPEIYEKKTIEKNWQKALDALRDKNISKFTNSRHTQQDIMLQTGLSEVFGGDLFNGFPKLINWLDENDKKGSSRFCSLRDACSHGITDVAYKKVNDMFPSEFQFEDNILRRDSQKNIQSIKKHLPEVLEQIKEIFKRRFNNIA
jgi:hypothetical protein